MQKATQEPEDTEAGRAELGAGLCRSSGKLFAGSRQGGSLTPVLWGGWGQGGGVPVMLA